MVATVLSFKYQIALWLTLEKNRWQKLNERESQRVRDREENVYKSKKIASTCARVNCLACEIEFECKQRCNRCWRYCERMFECVCTVHIVCDSVWTNENGVSKCKNVEINDSQLNQVCCGVVVSCNLIAYFISFAIHYSVVSPVRRVFLRMNSGVGRILFLVLNLCTWNVVLVVLVIPVHIYSSKTHKSLAKTMMLFRWKIL